MNNLNAHRHTARLCAFGSAASLAAFAAHGLQPPVLPAGSAAPPIHLVRDDVRAELPAGQNHALQYACLIVQGVPPAEAEARIKPLPAGIEGAFVRFRDEYFFEGNKQAVYHVSQMLFLDVHSADCSKPKIIRSFTAHVHVGCELAARGNAFFPDADGKSPRPPSFSSGAADGKTPTCVNGQPPPRTQDPAFYASLPVYSVAGLPCVSTADAVLKTTGQNAPPRSWDRSPDNLGLDTCLWSALPYYNGQRDRSIPLAASDHCSEATLKDVTASEREGLAPLATVLCHNARPVSFTVGTSIPPDRFTAAAARAFVNQPNTVELSATNATLR